MARSRQMLAMQIAEAAVELIECDASDPQCFYPAYDALGHLVDEWKRLKLGDPDRITGNASASTTDASKAAALKNIQRGSLRWKTMEALARQRVFSNGHGATVRELVTLLNRPHQTVSSAVNDLMNGGWLKVSPRPERGGQTVWAISDEGYLAYQERIA